MRSRCGNPFAELAELSEFRERHPEVDVHRDGLGVYYADAAAWRLCGRTLAEFLDKLRRRFPSRGHDPG